MKHHLCAYYYSFFLNKLRIAFLGLIGLLVAHIFISVPLFCLQSFLLIK